MWSTYLNLTSGFLWGLYYSILCIVHWVDISACGLFVPEGIIRPVVSVSALTWCIRYICHWNSLLLNNVIITKTNVLLPQVQMTLADFGNPVYALWFTCSQNFLNYLVSQLFDFERTWWRLFQSFDLERTWWRLFQKRVVRTKFDIYVFIFSRQLPAFFLLFFCWPL